MCRVENCVCIFLVREDIAIFATPYALPPHYGVFRNDATSTVVAYHASEHAVVRSGDIVVLVSAGIGYAWGAIVIKWGIEGRNI